MAYAGPMCSSKPRDTSHDMTGYTDYAVLVRTTPTGAWTHPWAFPPASNTLDQAQSALAYFLDLHQREVNDLTERVAAAKTDAKRAKRQGRLDALNRVEYRIFARQIGPYTPHDA